MTRSNDSVLDLGCGTGNNLLPYAKQGWRVMGIDIDEANIDICRRLMPAGTWLVGDVESSVPEMYRDIHRILCTEVIEHVHDWRRVITSLGQAEAGTQLYLTTPDERSEKRLLQARPEYWNEIGHVHFFSGPEIVTALTQAGWTDIQVRRRNAALYFELKSLFKRGAPCVRHTYYENILPLPLKLFWQLFRRDLFQTKLKYLVPLWIFTLPFAAILDHWWGATIVVTAKKSR